MGKIWPRGRWIRARLAKIPPPTAIPCRPPSWPETLHQEDLQERERERRRRREEDPATAFLAFYRLSTSSSGGGRGWDREGGSEAGGATPPESP
jgi:hypothetical protein